MTTKIDEAAYRATVAWLVPAAKIIHPHDPMAAFELACDEIYLRHGLFGRVIP